MMITRSLFIFLFLIPCLGLKAQEILIPLSGNPVAEEYYREKPAAKKASSSDTLELPFIDDFSDSFIEPDPKRWTDKRAYINNQYSLSQITAGIATLDAVDFSGAHYEGAGTNPYPADYLTSKPLNLEYESGDSIVLSFYYQAGGLGNQPNTTDSLCLDFKDRDSSAWVRVWCIPGTESTDFKFVSIPITDPNYLYKGFQFRFMNYASQTRNNDYPDKRANVDHWNLDYVILDKNRTVFDTVLRDVSFVKPLSTMLKDYSSIPWPHIEQAYFTQRAPFLTTTITNPDTITRNVTRSLRITDAVSGFTYNTTPTAIDILSGETREFNFEFDYPFDFGIDDSMIFEISTIIRTDAFDYKPNDTLRHIQEFKNYYSYDDGNAEAGYGLRGQGTQNSSVAVKFNAFRGDSLRAIRMHFNQLFQELNLNYFFYLRVWDDNGGVPGSIIYSKTGERPVYSADLNGFITYFLDEPIFVDGPFYVGYTKTVDKLSNIGIDLNHPNQSNNFYNLGQGWVNSSIPGSLMIRPVLSLQDVVTSSEPENKSELKLSIFPNPATDYFQIQAETSGSNFFKGKIFDITGRVIMDFPGTRFSNVNVSELKEGLYIIRIVNTHTGEKADKKLIIAR